MYFPFIISKNTNNQDIIVLGKHRLYSLYLNLNKINKKFLCIEVPREWLIDISNEYKFLGESKKDLHIYAYVNHLILTKQKTNDIHSIWTHFFRFSDYLGADMFAYKDEIKPHPIFNNEELFEKFIKNEKFTSN